MRVVTRTGGEFDADAVGFLLHAARIGAHEGEIADGADDVLASEASMP